MLNIAIWGGVVGMVVAVLALIIIVLIKADVKSTLSSEALLFDQNFNIKKQAIEKAEKLLDDLSANDAISQNPEFVRRAKESYNELLCVVTNQAIAESFKNFSLNLKTINENELNDFKIACRKDIGLKAKKIAVKTKTKK